MFAKIKSGRIESQRQFADYADRKKDKATQQKGRERQNEIAEKVVPGFINPFVALLFLSSWSLSPVEPGAPLRELFENLWRTSSIQSRSFPFAVCRQRTRIRPQ
jgi:hypothetical protein